MTIKIKVKETISVLEGCSSKLLKPGTYEMEIIQNPFAISDENRWLVVKGTKIGVSIASWKAWIKQGTKVQLIEGSIDA